jgi:hypothetical protein
MVSSPAHRVRRQGDIGSTSYIRVVLQYAEVRKRQGVRARTRSLRKPIYCNSLRRFWPLLRNNPIHRASPPLRFTVRIERLFRTSPRHEGLNREVQGAVQAVATARSLGWSSGPSRVMP